MLFHFQNKSWYVGVNVSIFKNKETELQEKFRKVLTSQWHSQEVNTAERRNVLFLYSEKVNLFIGATNHKYHIGLLVKFKKEGKYYCETFYNAFVY